MNHGPLMECCSSHPEIGRLWIRHIKCFDNNLGKIIRLHDDGRIPNDPIEYYNLYTDI